MFSHHGTKSWSTLLAAFLCIALIAGCAGRRAEWGDPRTGLVMAYRMPESGALKYQMSIDSTQNLEVMGQPVEMSTTRTTEFSVKLLGIEQANHRLDIIMDALAVSVDVPQVEITPDTSEVPGKHFEMLLSPLGEELELSGADAIQYDMGPDGKHNVASDFQIFFPDLAGRPVRIGDTWTSTGTITQKRERGDAVVHLQSVNTLAAIETVDGMPCAKVTAAVTGTLEGKSKVENAELVIRGELEGVETWYFAYQDGQLLKSDTEIHTTATVTASGPQQVTIPMTEDSRIVSRLLR
ncbi:MAG: hypothetical protein GY856_20270 [bacterium]|nr:hypothetical protein [bacterium]